MCLVQPPITIDAHRIHAHEAVRAAGQAPPRRGGRRRGRVNDGLGPPGYRQDDGHHHLLAPARCPSTGGATTPPRATHTGLTRDDGGGGDICLVRNGDIAWRERGHFFGSRGTKRLRLLWERGFLGLNFKQASKAKQSNEALAARSLGFGCTACIPRFLWGEKARSL